MNKKIIAKARHDALMDAAAHFEVLAPSANFAVIARELRKMAEDELIIPADMPTMEPIPDYGDHFSVDEFQSLEACNAITPDDGCGYYATESFMSDVGVFASHIPEWATHVVWFNR